MAAWAARGGRGDTAENDRGEGFSAFLRAMVSLFSRHDRFLMDIVIRSAQD
jgi:hypothetical protein